MKIPGRLLVSLVGVLLLLGGCEENDKPNVVFCEGPTRIAYAPESGRVDAFPDDYFTVEDPTTPTGLRVSMLPDHDVVADGALGNHVRLLHDISTLDGFGISSDLTLVLSGPIDESTLPVGGDGSGRPDASLVLVDLDASPISFLDFEWWQTPEGDGSDTHTLTIAPLGPLKSRTRYGVALTTKARDGQGACIAPSESMRLLLSGRAGSPRLERLNGRIQGLIDGLVQAGTITGPGELTAAFAFTTQSTWDTSAAVAAQIRQRTYPYQRLGDCTDLGPYRECEGAFDVDDYRIDLHHIDDTAPSPQQTHTVAVTTYLPATGSGPFPTVIYAHSLTRDRYQALRMANFTCPLGVAVTAIDAVLHGDHPEQPESPGEMGRLMAFMGMRSDLNPPIDGRKLRDNLRQSAYDKLQFLEMLRPGVDIDGDGLADVGIHPLGYVGASLGGIMAPEFLAFAPEVTFALTVVPGAKVGWIIQYGEAFQILVLILQDMASDGEMARLFPLLQAVIDRGDPSAYTRHVILERLPGFDQGTPHLLAQMAIGDEVVPNMSTLAYVQGLGLPLVGDALLPIPGVPHAPDLPTAENLSPGMTAGVFQYDIVWVGSGPDVEAATHRNVADNPITVHQSQHFLNTFLGSGVSEIVDPYRELGVK